MLARLVKKILRNLHLTTIYDTFNGLSLQWIKSLKRAQIDNNYIQNDNSSSRKTFL